MSSGNITPRLCFGEPRAIGEFLLADIATWSCPRQDLPAIEGHIRTTQDKRHRERKRRSLGECLYDAHRKELLEQNRELVMVVRGTTALPVHSLLETYEIEKCERGYDPRKTELCSVVQHLTFMEADSYQVLTQ